MFGAKLQKISESTKDKLRNFYLSEKYRSHSYFIFDFIFQNPFSFSPNSRIINDFH